MRIGVDRGGSKIEAAALDEAGRVALRRRVATPAGDYAAIIAAICRIVGELEAALGRRARFANDANCFALSEWRHSPLPWPADDERPGPPRYCGKWGCLETFLSGPGMSLDHAEAAGERPGAAAIAGRAAAGDAAAEAALERYEGRLARGLATVINLLDPDVIVLGGGLGQIDRLYENVPRRWGAYVFSDRVATRLVPPRHGDASGVRGTTWLWQPGEAP